MSPSGASEDLARLAPLDLTVIGVYMLGMLALGASFLRRGRTSDEFFYGGRRIPWWAAGVSIYATQLSAITYVSIPAKGFAEDWVFALTAVTLLAIAPLVIVFYLPFYRRLGVRTAYEYLERRFSLGLRLFGSASFIAFQLARMAIVVYLPALAVASVTGVDVYLCIALLGLLATAYTAMGGLEAVVWTDLAQVVVLVGGLVAAFALAVHGAGGFDAALELAREHDKLRWYAPATSWTETSTWSVLIGAMFLQLGPYTTDQSVVQRYLVTKDERAARRSLLLNSALAAPLTVCFFALGAALFAYYEVHPGILPAGMKSDEVLPRFVAREMPQGLAGLVFAGLFAAAMSTLDSAMHAIATAWTNDWQGRLGARRRAERARGAAAWAEGAGGLAVGRRVVVLAGLVGTAAATLIAALELRSLYDTFQSILGLLISPLAGVFALGIFTRRANARGVALGAAVAVAALAYAQRGTELDFMWYAPLGTTTCVLVGYAASRLWPAREDLGGLTWWTRGAAPSP